MGTGRDPEGGFDQAARESTEETTLADEEWPVAEQYRVEPSDARVDDGTIVIHQDVPPEPVPPRRFPPEIGRGLAFGLLAVLLALILIPAGIWLATTAGDDKSDASDTSTLDTTTTSPTTTTTTQPTASVKVTVPDVTGRRLQQARELLEKAALQSRFRRVASERPRDEVLSQTPKPGADVERSSIVVLTVSGGRERVTVPNVEGVTESEAIDLLRDAGLDWSIRLVPSTGPEGTVVEQRPAAGEEVVPEATVVVLRIAEPRDQEETTPPPTEPATVRVPSLVGLRSADARSRLRALGLRSTQRPVESSRPAGTVVSQSPGAGSQLREGGTVTLRVSTGPARVEVPDVVGLDEAAAIRELESAGFQVQVVDEPTVEPTEDGIVLDQSPFGGASRSKGATVTITVARAD